MGIPEIMNLALKTCAFAIVLLSLTAVSHTATEEVAELGGTVAHTLEDAPDTMHDTDFEDQDDDDNDDDDDEMGEGAGRGGGGFLATQGSFTLSGGAAGMGEEDEL